MEKSIQPRALVVEDDPSWQEILSEILTDIGLVVEAVGNFDDAVTCIRDIAHHLVVVDLSLKAEDHHNKDGLRVLDAVRLYDPGTLTILLTGHATVELAVKTMTEYSVLTCLRKEIFNRFEFRDLVKQHVLTSSLPRTMVEDDNVFGKQVESKKESMTKEFLGFALVVDDDAGWRNLLAELLDDIGYEVRNCSGFGEAVGYLNREKFDLAIVDLSLVRDKTTSTQSIKNGQLNRDLGKDYGGGRLLSSTRAAGIPTIVVSGITTPFDVELLYEEYGVFVCLEKQSFDRSVFLHLAKEARLTKAFGNELDNLTERERQVLALLARGMINKDIADTLMISTNTVKRHLKAVFKKLGVHTRSTAVSIAIKAGLSPG